MLSSAARVCAAGLWLHLLNGEKEGPTQLRVGRQTHGKGDELLQWSWSRYPGYKIQPSPGSLLPMPHFLPSAQEGDTRVMISEGCPEATGVIIAFSVAPPPDLSSFTFSSLNLVPCPLSSWFTGRGDALC